MQGIIYYRSNFDNAMLEMRNIISGYELMKINVDDNQSRTSSDSAFIVFEDGDVWRVLKASHNARGYGCNVAIIERGISEDIMRNIIKPSIKFPPYQAYNYYGCSPEES